MSADDWREKKRKANRPIQRGQDEVGKQNQQQEQGQQQHTR